MLCSMEWEGMQSLRGREFFYGGWFGVYVAGEWVQVLMEKRWYIPR